MCDITEPSAWCPYCGGVRSHPDDGEVTVQPSAQHKSSEAWLLILSDTSMSMSQRLEIASTDTSINKWFKFAAVGSSGLEQDGLEQLRSLAETSRDPVVSELYRGLQSLMQGMEMLAPEVVEEAESLIQTSSKQFDLTELVTDPSAPSILGDEWASFLEGLTAALGVAFVQQSNPTLALELATVFSARMERVPRVFALCGADGFVGFRGDWRNYLSQEDLDTLERDRIAADRYVADLAKLADHGARS